MEVTISKKPQMLLETVEVLFAYVNDLPVEMLTEEKPWCIPAQEMLGIMEDVCAGLSRHDPELRFFFEKTQLQNEMKQCTCIARNMACSSMDLTCSDLEEMARRVCQRWHVFMEAKEYPVAIGRCAISCNGKEEVSSLAQSLKSLPIEQSYRRKLLEALENFDIYMDRLVQLLTPVGKKLEPYLVRQASIAEPMFQSWEKYFAQIDQKDWMERHCLLSAESKCDCVYAAASYIGVRNSRFELDGETNRLSILLSAGYSMVKSSEVALQPWELTALRLLGSPVRISMIYALRERPMSTRELARELGLHLGAAGRDISSLRNARLLLVGLEDGHTRYRLNPLAFDTLAKDLLYLKPEN